MKIKKIICSTLMVTIASMSVQVATIGTALAGVPVCADGAINEACTNLRAGGINAAMPRIQWTNESTDIAGDVQVMLATTQGLDKNTLDGNSAATVLGLTPDKVAAMAGAFPANVPFVVGRYEPMNKILRVDVFKVEKAMVNGVMSSTLQTMVFSPAYGDYWKAMGTYLSPEQRALGASVGPNPFTAFATAGDDSFSNISLKGALVAVGHAQRYVGAPMSLMVVYQPKNEQYSHTSGGIFYKTTTTYVDTYALPKYYLGLSAGLQGGLRASFCANDVTATTCNNSQVASSGVSFQQMTGGNFLEDRTLVNRWSRSKGGLTGLTLFLLGGLTLLAIGELIPSLGIMVPKSAVKGTVGTGAPDSLATPVTGAFWANMLADSGITASSPLGSAFADAGLITNTTVSKAGYGGLYSVSGTAPAQESARETPPNPGHESQVQYVNRMATNGMVKGTVAQALAPVAMQLVGNCDTDLRLKDCTGASGIVPRADQYATFRSVEFIRDNGAPKRVGGF